MKMRPYWNTKYWICRGKHFSIKSHCQSSRCIKFLCTPNFPLHQIVLNLGAFVHCYRSHFFFNNGQANVAPLDNSLVSGITTKKKNSFWRNNWLTDWLTDKLSEWIIPSSTNCHNSVYLCYHFLKGIEKKLSRQKDRDITNCFINR